jgi:serine acetyltransferase
MHRRGLYLIRREDINATVILIYKRTRAVQSWFKLLLLLEILIGVRSHRLPHSGTRNQRKLLLLLLRDFRSFQRAKSVRVN